MIIPVRCFTCNMLIGSKYEAYKTLCVAIEKERKTNDPEPDSPDTSNNKTDQQKTFEILGLDRYCCRRHLISHTDLVDKI